MKEPIKLPEIQINRILARFDPSPHLEHGNHAKGLAVDINVFKDGKWLNLGTEPIWGNIRDFWLSRHVLAHWIPKDPNHLGFKFQGIT